MYKIQALMKEALRRNNLFSRSGTILSRCLGLGTEDEYRPVIQAGLMKFVDRTPPPRIQGWLTLTEAGATYLIDHYKELQ
jgi:hypothetical protein